VIIKLIKQISRNNFLWGAERIRGELLKLGIKVSKRTIQKYIPEKREKSGQTWKTFLKNHASQIWACDFTVVHDLFFQPIYIFVILELCRRQVVHTAVTTSPTDEWTAQQLREATPWDTGPKYLIRDRDSKYGKLFSSVAVGIGIKELKTPYQAPKANAFCERFMGSLKRECLDHMLIISQRQCRQIVKEYISYYNHARPHQGINQLVPSRDDQDKILTLSGRVKAKSVLNGLHHDYSIASQLH
jgi:transposase InsO family protein